MYIYIGIFIYAYTSRVRPLKSFRVYFVRPPGRAGSEGLPEVTGGLGTRNPQESRPPPNPKRQFTIIVDIFIILVFLNFLHQQNIYSSHGSYVFNHLQ